MEPEAQPDEPRSAIAATSRGTAYDCDVAARRLRAIAFVWVLVNVYLFVTRFSLLGTVPVGFMMAFVVVILSTWAALEGKRWGWFGMTLLAGASIGDFAAASVIIFLRGLGDHMSRAAIANAWLQELAWLDLGPTFGTMVVCIWFVSLAVLLSPSVRHHVFANKRRSLTPAQAFIGVCLVLAYLVGVITVGATSRAIRRHSLAVVRSLARAGGLKGEPPIALKLAQVSAQNAPDSTLHLARSPHSG